MTVASVLPYKGLTASGNVAELHRVPILARGYFHSLVNQMRYKNTLFLEKEEENRRFFITDTDYYALNYR